MKHFAIVLALCMLLGGCVAQQNTEPQPSNPPGSYGPSQPFTPETEYPTPPEPPTGENSDAPAPEEGPEGLPTPAL